MMRIENKIKESFDSIPVPDGLDLSIAKGIQRADADKAKHHKVKNNKMISYLRPVAAVLGLIIILGTLSNTSKTFVAAVEDIPIIGYIVKTLTFVDHEASGGQINDGLNLSDMESVSQETTESIFISFTTEDETVELASTYGINAYEHPNVLAFTISGIRMMDMLKDFEVISQSSLVEDVYRVITLDDSMVRFNIVLNPKVTYEVIEHASPARLEVKLSTSEAEEAKAGETATLYNVRSYSYPAGESFAIMEEGLMHSDIDYHILKDTQDSFVYEFGRFETKEQARDYVEQFNGTLNIFIDEVEAYALPDAVLESDS